MVVLRSGGRVGLPTPSQIEKPKQSAVPVVGKRNKNNGLVQKIRDEATELRNLATYIYHTVRHAGWFTEENTHMESPFGIEKDEAEIEKLLNDPKTSEQVKAIIKEVDENIAKHPNICGLSRTRQIISAIRSKLHA